MNRASGTFDVKLTPQATDDKADASLGRMSIDKQFHGDLEGTSKGEMLSASTSVKGSGAYVALERVRGIPAAWNLLRFFNAGLFQRIPLRPEVPWPGGGRALRDFDNKRCRTGAFAFAKATYVPILPVRGHYTRM